MRVLLRVLLLAVAFALGTAVFGWWAVPVLAAAWGVIAHDRRGAPVAAAAGGFAAWLGLLLWTAATGPARELADKLGALLGAPGAGLVALTLLFPALAAWSAAYVGAAIARVVAARAVAGRR